MLRAAKAKAKYIPRKQQIKFENHTKLCYNYNRKQERIIAYEG
jgi:hypothetical protein